MAQIDLPQQGSIAQFRRYRPGYAASGNGQLMKIDEASQFRRYLADDLVLVEVKANNPALGVYPGALPIVDGTFT